MVKSVYGYCNGEEIIFTQNDEGQWTTVVPRRGSKYVIELWAEDYAGNKGYAATIQFIYNPNNLCFDVKILEVGSQFTIEEIQKMLNGNKVCSSLVDTDNIEFGLMPETILSEVTKCEVCGQ